MYEHDIGFHGPGTEKRGSARCPVDHKIHLTAAHDAIAKLAQTCLPSSKARADDSYLHRLQDVHDRLVGLGADCDGAKVRQAVDSRESAEQTKARVFKSLKPQFLDGVRDPSHVHVAPGGDFHERSHLAKCLHNPRFDHPLRSRK